MKSRSVMTEIVLCLSLVNGISQSLNIFGLKPDTRGIVAVTIGESEGDVERQVTELREQVEGIVIAENEDTFSFVESEVCKLYSVTKEEKLVDGLEGAVVMKIATKI